MPDYSRYKFLKIDIADKLATVTLNRPDSLNALNRDMHRELEDIWLDLADDENVTCVLLTGAGRAFCAGGDVKNMAARVGTDEVNRRIAGIAGRRLIHNILDFQPPIIGAINGDAAGLGATIALMCDITVAADTARIGDTHVKVGLVAGDGGAVLWPLLVGPARAKEFLMRGTFLKGTEAERLGLVNYSLPLDQVLPKAREIATELAQGPALAIRWTKLAVNKWLREQVNLIFDASNAYEKLSFYTEDHKEATRAFVEKRKPKFTGM
jgi:enoyl-CoA hydratase